MEVVNVDRLREKFEYDRSCGDILFATQAITFWDFVIMEDAEDFDAVTQRILWRMKYEQLKETYVREEPERKAPYPWGGNDGLASDKGRHS